MGMRCGSQRQTEKREKERGRREKAMGRDTRHDERREKYLLFVEERLLYHLLALFSTERPLAVLASNVGELLGLLRSHAAALFKPCREVLQGRKSVL